METAEKLNASVTQNEIEGHIVNQQLKKLCLTPKLSLHESFANISSYASGAIKETALNDAIMQMLAVDNMPL